MSARTSLLLATLAGALSGCVIVYGATAPPPGYGLPATTPSEGDVSLGVGAARNLLDQVEPKIDGTLVPQEEDTPLWPALDLALRQGLGEHIGFEARLNGSVLLPLPFPIPNGFSLAPVVHIVDFDADRTLRLYATVRGSRTAGLVFVDLGKVEHQVHASGWGGEAAVTLTWEPADEVALAATPFVRLHRMSAFVVDETEVPGPRSHWTAWGGGLTGAAHLNLGPFRAGLGGALEVVPDAAAGLSCEPDPCPDRPAARVVPQATLQLGAAWR